MIQPVNGHLLIEPIKQDTFIANQNDTYEEIGVVKAIPREWNLIGSGITEVDPVEVGDKVYFDAWLAAKFPKDKDGFYWLVKWEDVRAVENAKSEPIPE